MNSNNIFVTVKCPKCGSTEMGRTRRVGYIDNFMSYLGFFPYYCHSYACRKRFFLRKR